MSRLLLNIFENFDFDKSEDRCFLAVSQWEDIVRNMTLAQILSWLLLFTLLLW